MQNRYVGGIGDYLKLSILRTLSVGYRLGVAWWLFPDEPHNGDGRHVGYLNHPGQWRHFDPAAFNTLNRIVSSDDRNIRALQASHLIAEATCAGIVILTTGLAMMDALCIRECRPARRSSRGTPTAI